ncbi:hypothetical protein FRACYDRAFT_232078 [Fragilariopsis cylindrus CCMP1102]|uniref:Uncharacterized protein n=1 Tax=Fragilariopsis cylindrus CCMP1102 TaxID=635003 RepID=A0A1E7FUU7_9STRA|nr:hypothetical protein FRACYDRAFT_232078 [Fragilariopsis cylindrus CCMP1102]|eukprot:OEU21930.1 hypothetical protein FRACYDRAFT_232078 [Fragilariopsis cylindrus CCMP1102]
MGGVVMMLTGAAVYYLTGLQLTIAQSSTEAEFMNMGDAGNKEALYLQWILEEIGLNMDKATRILAQYTPANKMVDVTCKNEALYEYNSDSLSKPTGQGEQNFMNTWTSS